MKTLKFEEMELSSETLNGIKSISQIDESTELQEAVIPVALDEKDALIKAEKGNEKYLSYVLPAIEKIVTNKEEGANTTSVIILTSDDEESENVLEVFQSLGPELSLKTGLLKTESSEDEQRKVLEDGNDIIIAHPETLAENLKAMRMIFRHLNLLVIDSGQKLLSENHGGAINRIRKRIISTYQTLIYASEINAEIEEYTKSILDNPERIGFNDADSPGQFNEPPEINSNLSQGYIYVPGRMKISTLMAHLENHPDDNCIIFSASKRGTDRLYKALKKRNKKATSLHGKLSDEKRAQRFANFTKGDRQYLLVADISASELDIQQVKQVINYDVPGNPDEYRYRADLVGSGKAASILSLVSKQDRSDINQLENKLGQAPKELPLPEEVQKKLKQRKQKKKSQKSSENGRQKKKKKKNKDESGLPRPSYDKLSGGRSGNKKKEEKSGVIGLIKKLFS